MNSGSLHITLCYEIPLMCCIIKQSWTLYLGCIANLGVLVLLRLETKNLPSSQHLTVRESSQGFACGQNQPYSVIRYAIDSDAEMCITLTALGKKVSNSQNEMWKWCDISYCRTGKQFVCIPT